MCVRCIVAKKKTLLKDARIFFLPWRESERENERERERVRVRPGE